MAKRLSSRRTATESIHSSRCNSTTLRKASRNLSQFYDTVLSQSGLRSTQRTVLIHVERAGAPTVGELAESLLMDRTGLSHTLKPLIREGLLDAVQDEGDKRSRRITLTDLGRKRLKESLPYWQMAQDSFEKYFGVQRAQELRELLVMVADFEFPSNVSQGR